MNLGIPIDRQTADNFTVSYRRSIQESYSTVIGCWIHSQSILLVRHERAVELVELDGRDADGTAGR